MTIHEHFRNILYLFMIINDEDLISWIKQHQPAFSQIPQIHCKELHHHLNDVRKNVVTTFHGTMTADVITFYICNIS